MDSASLVSRRAFFKQLCHGGVLLAAAPMLLGKGLPAAGSRSPTRSLVCIHLSGGNDAFNTVVPMHAPAYVAARPTLAIRPSEALPLADGLGLHPALAPLLDCWHRDELVIMPGVGSHDKPLVHGTGYQWDVADLGMPVIGEPMVGACVHHPAFTPLYPAPRGATQVAPAPTLSDKLQRCVDVLGSRSAPVALVLQHDGYDTHVGQREAHARLLNELATGLAAFRNALLATDHWNDTVILVTSEFGRSLAENRSGGTDHGPVGLVILLGGRIGGGKIVGAYTSTLEASNTPRSNAQRQVLEQFLTST